MACLALPVFPHSHKRHDFREEKGIENVFSYSLQLLPETFLILRRTERPMIKTAYWSSYKGKAVLLQAWSGPEGSRKLRFSDFMKTAQDGGMVVSLTHRPPLPRGNTPGTHFS